MVRLATECSASIMSDAHEAKSEKDAIIAPPFLSNTYEYLTQWSPIVELRQGLRVHKCISNMKTVGPAVCLLYVTESDKDTQTTTLALFINLITFTALLETVHKKVYFSSLC